MPRYGRLHESVPFRDLPGAALRASLREGYDAAKFRADLLAGIVVGVVALPLSMALAIAVGVPPQHGLYTAIVAGVLVPLLGGSRLQVTGPTAAFVVILAPIHTQFGLGGLLAAGLIAGLFLIVFAVARFGRLLRFVPHPVTTGFTAGIGVVIATLQLRDFLGLTVEHMPEHYLPRVWALASALPSADLPAIAVGAFTLAVLVGFPRVTSRVPAPLAAIAAATLLSGSLHAALGHRFEVATIGSRFSFAGGLPIPGLPWRFDDGSGGSLALAAADGSLDFGVVQALLRAGLAIAMLGAIESLLSAVVADGMGGGKHDPDAELFGLGVGNVVAPFFGGIACTGAIARTATNIRAGAKTPVACVVHAVFILAAMLALSPLLRFIPMASLAALLLLVAWRMSEAKHFVHIARVAPRSDVAVLFACFGLTVVFDMVVGVTVGVMLAAVLFMKRMAEVTDATVIVEGAVNDAAAPDVPKGVMLYEIHGPLFFGAAEKAMSQLQVASRGTTRVVILAMEDVFAIDATGLVALESALAAIHRAGAVAILCAVQPQPERVLRKAHLDEAPGRLHWRPELASAMELARTLAATSPRGAPEVTPAPASGTA